MSKILHCGAFRKAKSYYLEAADTQFRYEILRVAICPQHPERPVLEWQAMRWDGERTPSRRVPSKEREHWMARIKTDLITEEKGRGRMLSDSRGHCYVSDYTMLISQSPEQVSKRVLREIAKKNREVRRSSAPPGRESEGGKPSGRPGHQDRVLKSET